MNAIFFEFVTNFTILNYFYRHICRLIILMLIIKLFTDPIIFIIFQLFFKIILKVCYYYCNYKKYKMLQFSHNYFILNVIKLLKCLFLKIPSL